MARPLKAGLDYFPRDTDIHSNRRVRRLLLEHGAIAFVVWDYVLCEIYKGEGYYLPWDQHLAFDIAHNLRDVTEQQVVQVLNTCLKLGLLCEDMHRRHGVLTSAGIQERYMKAKKKGVVKEEYLLMCKCGNVKMCKCGRCEGEEEIINSEETGVNSAITRVIAAETPINDTKTTPKRILSTQSKVKKRKGEREENSKVKIQKSKNDNPPPNADMKTENLLHAASAVPPSAGKTENLLHAASAVPPSAGKTPPPPPHALATVSFADPGSAGDQLPSASGDCLLPLATASEVYRSNTFVMAREQLCATRQITMQRLLEWITAFDTMLIERGERAKTANDYARHFRSWLVYQKVSEPISAAKPPGKQNIGIPLKGIDDLLRERERKRAG